MKKKKRKDEERTALNGEGKESILSKMSRYTDVSLCAFSDFKIEIERLGKEGERSVTAYGVQSIRKMEKHCVALDYSRETFVLKGEELLCKAYADGAINVRGRIKSTHFCKKGEADDADT